MQRRWPSDFNTEPYQRVGVGVGGGSGGVWGGGIPQEPRSVLGDVEPRKAFLYNADDLRKVKQIAMTGK